LKFTQAPAVFNELEKEIYEFTSKEFLHQSYSNDMQISLKITCNLKGNFKKKVPGGQKNAMTGTDSTEPIKPQDANGLS